MSSNPHHYPTFEPHTPSRNEWAGPLVVACLALGLVMGWGNYELRYRVRDSQMVSRYRHDLDLVLAEDSKLGILLADPRTKIMRLDGTDVPQGPATPIRDASLAWNNDRQQGALFCSSLAPLPSGQVYQVWLIPSDGTAVPVAINNVQSGQSIYAIEPLGTVQMPVSCVLTAGAPTSALAEAGQVVAKTLVTKNS